MPWHKKTKKDAGAKAEGGAADAVLFASGAHAAMRVRPGAGGALLLNARGMNAAEAANAVRRRAREPIF